MSKKQVKKGSIKLVCPSCGCSKTFKPHELKECRDCGYVFTKKEILRGDVL